MPTCGSAVVVLWQNRTALTCLQVLIATDDEMVEKIFDYVDIRDASDGLRMLCCDIC